MTTTSPQLWLPPSVVGHPRPRLLTPPSSSSTEAVRVLRTAARSGLLRAPIPYQVYVHARIAEMVEARRRWRRAGAVIGRGNGKSTGVLAPYVLDSLEQGIGVLGLAQNLDVAMETFNQVADTIEADPHLRKRIRKLYRGKGQARIDLTDPRTGRVAVYRPSVTAKKCRGPRAPRIAVDESAYVSNDVMSAARYVQNGSGVPHLQQVLAVCTAGDDMEDDKGDLQWFSRWRNAFIEGTDPDLLWLEYSIPEEADPFDPAWWPYAVPALGYFITAQEIADNLDDPTFVREALSRWGVTSKRAIRADWWNPLALTDAQVEQLDADPPRLAGLAVASSPDTDVEKASIVASYRWGGRILTKLVADRPGTGWVAQAARAFMGERRVPVGYDAKGPAASLADDLAAAGLDLAPFTTEDYTGACANYLRDIKAAGLWHYGDRQPGMQAAVASARTKVVGDRWVWARRAGDICALEAATIAAAAVRHAPQKSAVITRYVR